MVELANTEYPSSPHFKDRSGQTINGIQVIKFLGQDKNYNSVYLVKCPYCGNEWDARINGIISGNVKGCGCMSSRKDASVDKWESHIGEIHNRLKIIGFERVWSGNRYRPHYICECDCGTINSIRCQQVLEGKTVSCGCKTIDVNRERSLGSGYTNGLYRSGVYVSWRAMHDRCYKNTNDHYMDYGGRGIYICDEWYDKETGFMNFYRWSISHGYKDGLTIDRIDVNGPYCPENCRWATTQVQSFNKSNTKYISIKLDFNNINKPDIIYCFPLGIWAKIIGVDKSVLSRRIKKVGIDLSVHNAIYGCRPNKMLLIPQEYMIYNRPEKYAESIHD